MGYRSEVALTLKKEDGLEKRRRAGAYKTSKRKRVGTQFDVLREHH